jgi:hypothetical protein
MLKKVLCVAQKNTLYLVARVPLGQASQEGKWGKLKSQQN